MKNLAIIPARSGSKGLKDKNIKLLNGKPLMGYTIQAALESSLFDTVFVSTDSEEYADIAREYGIEIPFLRESVNASDGASSWDVVREVVGRFKKLGKEFDTFALLQPTSPLRDSEDIIKAYHILKSNNADAVVSLCESEHSPLWCNTLPENNCLENFIKDEFTKRRQDLKKFYRINGAIYVSKVDTFLDNSNIYGRKSFAMIMDSVKSIDIDGELDFTIAEALIKSNS